MTWLAHQARMLRSVVVDVVIILSAAMALSWMAVGTVLLAGWLL